MFKGRSYETGKSEGGLEFIAGIYPPTPPENVEPVQVPNKIPTVLVGIITRLNTRKKWSHMNSKTFIKSIRRKPVDRVPISTYELCEYNSLAFENVSLLQEVNGFYTRIY